MPRSPGRFRRLAVATAALALVFSAAVTAAELTYRLYFLAADRLPSLLSTSGTFDIYAVGDSTMEGKPYAPGLSIPLLVRRMLGGTVGGRKIVLHVVARQGDSAGPQLLALAREIRFRDKTRPGVVIVYQGHNDAWQDAPGDPDPRTVEERLTDLLAPRLFIAEEMLSAMERARWIASRRTLGTYEYNLRGIIELSRARGLTPILSTSIGMVSSIEPGLWETPADPANRLRALLAPGMELEKHKEWDAAGRYYRELLAREPSMASYLRFRLGKCSEGRGDFAAARRWYWDAIDSDSNDRFRRATQAQNALVRALARSYSIPLVDAVSIFEAQSPHGLVGAGLFADGHHPNIRGVLLLARAYADAISRITGAKLADPIADPAAAFAAFGYGPRRQVDALLDSAGWLLYVARGHVFPRLRLALARERYRAAISIEPDRVECRFGLALAEAADPENPKRRAEDVDWLYRNFLEQNLDGANTKILYQDAADRFLRDGVPRDDVAQLLRVSQFPPPTNPDR